MHAQSLVALGVPEYLYRVSWVGMHGTHDPSRLVRSDGDQSEIEWPTELAHICEGGTVRKVGVFGTPVILAFGVARYGTVAGVACEVDGFAGGVLDSPRRPEGGGAVIQGTS